uniref:Hexosyltransferase n=1 Tax=Strigamia maritima TaxID=126957 RepID=T1JIK3_STRMM
MSRPKHRVWMLGLGFLVFCTMLYFPILFSFRPPMVEWLTMKRDLRYYVSELNDTAIISPIETCLASPDNELLIIVVVCSSIENMAARVAIRATWGSPATYNQSQFRLIFFLGRSENDSSQASIFRESEEYGDIVQEDFIDTYNNLTLKSVMMLLWVGRHCQRARFLLKTDDDTFVHLEALRTALKQRDQPNLLLGSLICGAIPIKDRKSKWYSPSSMYRENVYPNYLSGTAYVVSRDLIRPLFKTALETPFFHLEDIFITGICARKNRIRPQDHIGFSYQRRRMDPCLFRRVITSHRMNPNDMRRMWYQMHHEEGICNVTRKMRLRNYNPQRCFV